MSILTSNAGVITLSWLAVIAHLTFGIFAWRRGSAVPLLPVINFAMALCLAAYWAQRLISALANGRVWYASDQVWLVYGVIVCGLSLLALGGRATWSALHWTIFGAHAAVSLAAAIFFSFISRINKLF